jgi:hypothetical protein
MTTTAAAIPTAGSTGQRAWRILLALVVIASGFSLAGLTLTTAPAQAANVTVNQCNNRNAGPPGATTGITCTVTVVNNISASGRTSSTVTVRRQCSLTACAPGNGTFTTSSRNLVTRVTQCNGSANDAAPPLVTCTVSVTNNISAGYARARTAPTVNQCVGSGTGGGRYSGQPRARVCDPIPASTTNATVTQCNGSATGGGSTVHCSVGTGSRISRAIPIRVNQCNGTGNAGGTLVTCRTSIRTNVIAARAVTPAAAATPGAGTPQITAVPSGGVAAGGGTGGGSGQGVLLSLGGALLLAGSATALFGWRAARER